MRSASRCSPLLALVLAAACSNRPAGAPAGKRVDAATAGSLSGRITFQGVSPVPQIIKMASADPGCGAETQTSDAVLVGKAGELQNVFVYVTSGLDSAYTFDVPTEALKFYQRGCRYTPRIFGVRAGQPVEIINDDDTMHNVHALPRTNAEFNSSQTQKGATMTRTFAAPEVMVRFKCDVHPWMAAYAGVMAHPFFAVSDASGAFEIKGLPPGTYAIDAWHERFGRQTEQVTIAGRQPQTVAFTFAAK